MDPLRYITGDLIQMAKDGEFDVIIHGANIFNTMGSGIAAQIRTELPDLWLIDQHTAAGDIRKLGQWTTVQLPHPGNSFEQVLGINLYTQATIGNPGNNVDYDAYARGMYGIKMMLESWGLGHARIGIPKIGAGLGGADWALIERLTNTIGFKDITCVEYVR